MVSVRCLGVLATSLFTVASAWQGHAMRMIPAKCFAGPTRLAKLRMGTATVADLDQARLALLFFLDDKDATITPTSGGVNNIVQYVQTKSGERYVLRIYNNGCDTPRVLYEHSVLEQLHQLSDQLTFDLPRYLPSRDTGKTMVELPSGTQCCICQCIPGGLPKTADPRPLGRAAGQLLMALGKVSPDKLQGEPCHPYYDIYKAHSVCTRESFYEYIQGPGLDCCRDAINTLSTEFSKLDRFIAEYLPKSLPQQITHGDLHYDNVLCDEATGEVTGLLDFEFASMDWRAMELAVCLSKYVGEPEPFPLVEAFIDGFAEYGRLTRDECNGLADMINLRVMSNCVYFVGRAIAGEDSIESLTSRADMYAQRVVWVRQNRERIVACITARMQALDPSF